MFNISIYNLNSKNIFFNWSIEMNIIVILIKMLLKIKNKKKMCLQCSKCIINLAPQIINNLIDIKDYHSLNSLEEVVSFLAAYYMKNENFSVNGNEILDKFFRDYEISTKM